MRERVPEHDPDRRIVIDLEGRAQRLGRGRVALILVLERAEDGIRVRAHARVTGRVRHPHGALGVAAGALWLVACGRDHAPEGVGGQCRIVTLEATSDGVELIERGVDAPEPEERDRVVGARTPLRGGGMA